MTWGRICNDCGRAVPWSPPGRTVEMVELPASTVAAVRAALIQCQSLAKPKSEEYALAEAALALLPEEP